MPLIIDNASEDCAPLVANASGSRPLSHAKRAPHSQPTLPRKADHCHMSHGFICKRRRSLRLPHSHLAPTSLFFSPPPLQLCRDTTKLRHGGHSLSLAKHQHKLFLAGQQPRNNAVRHPLPTSQSEPTQSFCSVYPKVLPLSYLSEQRAEGKAANWFSIFCSCQPNNTANHPQHPSTRFLRKHGFSQHRWSRQHRR